MNTVAFSTVACPDWTLDLVAARAAAWGYTGVELRTFGFGPTPLACDPCLTSPAKIRGIFNDVGVSIVSLGTSIRFDAPIQPPIVGRVLVDQERPVRQAKRLIDLAAQLECPAVRVFAFEAQTSERPEAAMGRITERLWKVIDHADRTGVRLAIENGGSYPRARDIRAFVESSPSALLGVSYSSAVAHAAGDDPAAEVPGLAPSLLLLRVKDLDHGRPVPLGQSGSTSQQAIKAVRTYAPSVPVVVEWDRAWLPDLADAATVLPGAAKLVNSWLGGVQARQAVAAR